MDLKRIEIENEVYQLALRWFRDTAREGFSVYDHCDSGFGFNESIRFEDWVEINHLHSYKRIVKFDDEYTDIGNTFVFILINGEEYGQSFVFTNYPWANSNDKIACKEDRGTQSVPET